MSTQSIINKDCHKLSEDADKIIICMADKLLSKELYMVGEGYNRLDFIRVNRLNRILCEDNCLLDKESERIKEQLTKIGVKYL